MTAENNCDKKLVIVLYGEPRGLGNHKDCPGTDQLHKILSWPDFQNFKSVHVIFSVTDKKVSFQNWDNDYMIDMDGERWSSVDYLSQHEIKENIDRWMELHDSNITWEINFRQPNPSRWGVSYHHVILKALETNADFFIFHRPDSNLNYEHITETKYKNFKTFMNYDSLTPAVACVQNNEKIGNHMWDEVEKNAIMIWWTNFEIMMWNREGLRAAEKFFHIKAINDCKYMINDDELLQNLKDKQFMSRRSKIGSAEPLWAIILMAISITHPDFVVLDVLPFRSCIRSKASMIPAHFIKETELVNGYKNTSHNIEKIKTMEE